jgi:hypothetical protein
MRNQNPQDMVEEIGADLAGATLFNESLIAARASSDKGRYLVVRGAEAYVGKRLFGIYDRKRETLVAGGAVIDGEIASVFKNFTTAPKNDVDYKVLPYLLEKLVAVGGELVVCQKGLLEIYGGYGFKKIASAKPIDKTEPEKYYLLLRDKSATHIEKFSDYKSAKGFAKKLMTKNKLARVAFHGSPAGDKG